MKFNFRTIGKTGFLLVMIGFFMRIFNRLNGFQFAELFISHTTRGVINPTIGVIIVTLLYLWFASALAGLVIGVISLKKKIPIVVDWVIILICIGAGLGVVFSLVFILKLKVRFLSGAYVILSGWIITVIAQIISMIRKESEKEEFTSKTNNSLMDFKRGGVFMLEFVAKVFRGWVNALLWLVLIGCAIGGFVAFGLSFGYDDFNGGYAFLGLLAGGLVGLITVILSGGLIANFLNMVDDISRIKYHLSKTGTPSDGNSSGGVSFGPNLSNVKPLITVNAADSWVCKKCGERNPNTSSSCKGCGGYK
jgi:ribosomal protein L40E